MIRETANGRHAAVTFRNNLTGLEMSERPDIPEGFAKVGRADKLTGFEKTAGFRLLVLLPIALVVCRSFVLAQVSSSTAIDSQVRRFAVRGSQYFTARRIMKMLCELRTANFSLRDTPSLGENIHPEKTAFSS